MGYDYIPQIKQNDFEDIATLITDLPLDKVNEIAEISKKKRKNLKNLSIKNNFSLQKLRKGLAPLSLSLTTNL